MSPLVIADRYAGALFQLALENNTLENTLQEIQFLRDTYQTQKEVRLFLESPILPPTRKIEILQATLLPFLSPMLRDFIILLTRRRREHLLNETCDAFLQRYRKYKGIVAARVTFAQLPSPALLELLSERIKEAFRAQSVEIQTHIDPSLIGGFVLEVGEATADMSIAHALHNARKKLLN